MDGVTVIRVIRQIKIEIAVINEQPDTTPLVTPARQTASPPPSDMKKRCFNAFLILASYTAGIGSITLGGTYINDCPDQNMLPIGLIIFGGILLVSRLLNCVYDCRSVFDEEDSENTPPCIQALNVIFFLASFGMFIAGTIFSRCGKRYYIQELAWTESLSSVRFVNLESGDMKSDTTDTTRLVTQAPQRALPPPPKKNERCFNAFLILFSYTVGIGSLIIGGTYINDCPDQKMLPIGLIIFGGILVVSRLLNCVYDCRSMFDEDDLEDTPPCIQALSVIFFFASLGMFMAVCLWTISLDPTTKPEDRDLKNYYDSTLSHAGAWVCIAGIVFFVMPVFSGCCGGIFSACCSS